VPCPVPRRVLLAFAAVLVALAPAEVSSRGARPSGAGGIKWSVPRAWSDLPGSSMRVATYKVPGPKGAEAGEVVFFKLTGPAATVGAAQADFDALVASVAKGRPGLFTRGRAPAGRRLARQWATRSGKSTKGNSLGRADLGIPFNLAVLAEAGC